MLCAWLKHNLSCDSINMLEASLFTSSFTACSELCDTVFDERASCKICIYASIGTGCEGQGTALRSAGNLLQMKQSVKSISSRIYTERCGGLPGLI